MKIFHQKRGFTLVELLVVVAIIGLLASIAIAAIGNARNKAKNTAIKENMYSLKLAAELEYDSTDPHSYEGVCDDGGTGEPTTNDISDDTPDSNFDRIRTAINNNGVTVVGESGRVCYDSTAKWCFEANGMPYNSENWCVDSAGYAGSNVNCDDVNYNCASDG